MLLPGGRSDQALEIPEVQMSMVPRVLVGDLAPEFTVKTFDGKDLKLSDFKGRYALVDFFSTRSSPEANDIPALKAAATAFVGDDRLVMIGIGLGSPEEMRQFTQKNGLTWTAATLDPKQPTLHTFGIRNLPSIWLIGPDGKVLAKNLRGDAIKSSLTAALGPLGM
jgi:peroxiredoxin